jgi:hypothetical protein
MPRPTLFISHSSREAASQARVEAIAAALEAQFDPWLDRKSIRFGIPWHRQIDEALMGCDAAIVLLDCAAIGSDFVTHEISVLCTRAAVEEDFRFFPIILDPEVTPAKLGGGTLGAAQLNTLQVWRPSAADLADNAQLAASIAAKITEEIGRTGDPEPRRERIIRRIRRALNVPHEDAFIDALEAMESRTGLVIDDLRKAITIRNPERRRWLLAKWFVEQARTELRPVIEFLKPFYGQLRASRDQKDLMNLIDAAEAYWIGSFDTNCPIYLMTRYRKLGGVVAVNGAHVAEYTVSRFAHRALTPDSAFIVVKCDNGCLTPEAVIASIQASLGQPGPPLKLEKARNRSEEIPTICVLPQKFITGVADTEDLDELQRTFASIVFVVWPGPTMDELLVPTLAERINPSVDLAMEQQRHHDWERLSAAIPG